MISQIKSRGAKYYIRNILHSYTILEVENRYFLHIVYIYFFFLHLSHYFRCHDTTCGGRRATRQQHPTRRSTTTPRTFPTNQTPTTPAPSPHMHTTSSSRSPASSLTWSTHRYVQWWNGDSMISATHSVLRYFQWNILINKHKFIHMCIHAENHDFTPKLQPWK